MDNYTRGQPRPREFLLLGINQGYLFSVECVALGTTFALFSEAAGSPLCLEVAKSLLLAGL